MRYRTPDPVFGQNLILIPGTNKKKNGNISVKYSEIIIVPAHKKVSKLFQALILNVSNYEQIKRLVLNVACLRTYGSVRLHP